MLKLFTTLLILCSFCTLSIAQNQINLHIHHKLGTEDFAFNQTSQNNLGHDFYLTRLEYYISTIVIKHDGGLKVTLEDLWILVDANEPTEINLGSYDINTVERITFSIGVDADHNHGDPASFAFGHPLAPQFPSMHWGWASGYRFLALEGESGADLNQNMEIHSLGDNNYFSNGNDLLVPAEDGVIDLHLDADYTRILENIDLTSGLVVHDEIWQAKTALENCRDFVFSPSSLSTSTSDLNLVEQFKVFPNPTSVGQTTIELSLAESVDCRLEVRDVLGRQIQLVALNPGRQTLDLALHQKGVYLLQIVGQNQIFATRKLIVH